MGVQEAPGNMVDLPVLEGRKNVEAIGLSLREAAVRI